MDVVSCPNRSCRASPVLLCWCQKKTRKENSIALGKSQCFGPANFQNRWIYGFRRWLGQSGMAYFGICCTLGFWPSGRFECSASADLFHCASVPGQWRGHPTWWDGFLTWCGLTRRVILSHEILGPCMNHEYVWIMNMYESIMIIRKSTFKSKWNAYVKRILMALKKTRPFLHHTTWYDLTVQGQASMPYISWRHSWSWPMC